jgi:hypothetical protein
MVVGGRKRLRAKMRRFACMRVSMEPSSSSAAAVRKSWLCMVVDLKRDVLHLLRSSSRWPATFKRIGCDDVFILHGDQL